MTFGEFIKFLCDTAMQVLSLEIPVMEFRVSFLQMLIFTSLGYLISRLIFGFGSKGGASEK